MTATPFVPPPSESLSSVDYAWLRMDEPTNLMVITGVFFLEKRLAVDRIREIIEQRLLRIPRFRQRATKLRGGRVIWEIDPEIDLDHHVVATRLPEPGDEAALQDFVGKAMSEPLDPERPLWKFLLIENYGQGGAIVTRVHHCLGDGLALMLVMLSLTDQVPNAESNPLLALYGPDAPVSEAALEIVRQILPEGVNLMVRAGKGDGRGRSRANLLARGTGALGRLVFRSADPSTAFKGALGFGKRATWSDAISLDHVKDVKDAVQGTINDVLLTAMAGGLRRYLQEIGQAVDGIDFRAAVPVSLRPLAKLHHLGNQFGLVFLKLPVGMGDPIERLREFQSRMAELKGSLEAGVVYLILGAMGKLPRPGQRLVERIFGTKATVVMTNVPGPREILYLAGNPIRDIMFWVPQAGRLGVGISILSYAGQVRLGVASDAALVPDPGRIVAGFHRELEHLAELAGAADRR